MDETHGPRTTPEEQTGAAEQAGKRRRTKLQKLDEKVVAALPAAAILQSNEKLMDLFARGKKRGTPGLR